MSENGLKMINQFWQKKIIAHLLKGRDTKF